jgi:DNA recombination protein RmuC
LTELFLPILVALGIGLLMGWLLGRLRGAQRIAAAEATAGGVEARRRELEAQLDEAQQRAHDVSHELAVANERLSATSAALEEQKAFLADSRRQLEDSFSALAASALKGSTEQFLALAEQRLKSSQAEATADLEERKVAIEAMLKPLSTALDKLDRANTEMEKTRAGAYSQIDEQIRALTDATASLSEKTTVLSTTLRGSSGKGRWGEVALRNIVELAGLTEHVDFEEQKTTDDGGRPDLTVRLPGDSDRLIAIDAKAPIGAYMEAAEATDEAKRGKALNRHVSHLRGHIKTLAGRDYAKALGAEVDLVVMFLPSDALLAEAYSRAPDLQTEALRQRILVATPTTLVALLRTVAIYWKQQALADHAAEIASVADTLYERAAKFGEEFAGVGRSLRAAIDSYNRAVGSFDRRLMPMAKRLEEMKVGETSRRKLDSPKGVDESVRLPRDRDARST